MQNLMLALSTQIYQVVLWLYPKDFQGRYALEMGQVFRALCDQVYAESGTAGLIGLWLPSLWDGIWSALYQWRLHLFQRKAGPMQTKTTEPFYDRLQLSGFQSGLAALPFLAFGISNVVIRLEFFRSGPVQWPLWQILLVHPYLVFNWVILLGLGAGVLSGFPRWTFSYLNWAILFAWWWSSMSFYGHTSDWKIWLPLLGVFLSALLLTRSWKPVRTMLKSLWRDWTLLSLALYTLYGYLFILSDEVHHPYLLLLIFITALAFSAGAWGYFRSDSPLRRVGSLIGGLLLAVLIGVISSMVWANSTEVGSPESSQTISLAGVLFLAIISLVMIATGLLALWRKTTHQPNLNKN